jgi:hypothetical protein
MLKYLDRTIPDATFTSVYSSDGKTSWSTFSFKLDTSLDNPDEHTVHFAICSQTYSDNDEMVCPCRREEANHH